jgi:hypothetical protein
MRRQDMPKMSKTRAVPRKTKIEKAPASKKNSKPVPRLNSSIIKTAVLGHFRFKEKWILFSTEASLWFADILMVDASDNLVEFEVKTTISDLKADFLKKKHKSYKNYKGKSGMVPNRLYFAVPKLLAPKAKEILEAYPAYGVITVDEFDRTVAVYKRAGSLHTFHRATEKAKRIIILRMGSELISLRQLTDKEIEGDSPPPLGEDILDLAPYVIK